MRKIIYTSLAALALIASAPRANAGWFNNHEQQLQQELNHERQTNGGLEIIIIVLGVGCVVAFVTGTITGSKTRKEAKHVQPESKVVEQDASADQGML